MIDITPREGTELISYHTELANYYLACKQMNVEIANTKPLPCHNPIKTKKQWLDRATKFDAKRKFHRDRARKLLQYLDK